MTTYKRRYRYTPREGLRGSDYLKAIAAWAGIVAALMIVFFAR